MFKTISVAFPFRYRKWDLGNGIELIVRCEHDAVMQSPSGDKSFINVKTLNEWDPRVSRMEIGVKTFFQMIMCSVRKLFH